MGLRSAPVVERELEQPEPSPSHVPVHLDDPFAAGPSVPHAAGLVREDHPIPRPAGLHRHAGFPDPRASRGTPSGPGGGSDVPDDPGLPDSNDSDSNDSDDDGLRQVGARAEGDPDDPAPTAGPGEQTIRVVVADDEYLVREGARSVLSAAPGVEVVGLASDPVELAALIDETSPDAVLLDIRMPPSYRAEGIEAAHRIRETHPHIGIVILSQYLDAEYALELLREGSSRVGYLLKERLGDQTRLVGAIREVVAGGSVLDPKVVDSLMEAQRRRSRSRLHGLTDREHEVLALMASGRNNAAIAREMVLSERAVEKHINSIFHRLSLNREMDINQRVSAVLFFLQRNTD